DDELRRVPDVRGDHADDGEGPGDVEARDAWWADDPRPTLTDAATRAGRRAGRRAGQWGASALECGRHGCEPRGCRGPGERTAQAQLCGSCQGSWTVSAQVRRSRG